MTDSANPATPKKSWWPTRKWWTQFAVLAGTVATMAWTGDGINTDDEKKAVVGIVVALVSTYLVPNRDDATQGGVPLQGGPKL